MQTKKLEAIYNEYLEGRNTQYALLITGSWGCGKTFFWKDNLEKFSKNKGYKTIYISLNGLNKIENLEHQMFIKLLPFISNQENKIVKNTTTVFTNLINVASKRLLKANIGDLFKGLSVDSFDFSNYIICFDDLERSRVPLKEVLGFINNFVEHKKLKTIILADESNIDLSPKDYDNIKEKTIGRILNFELEIDITLPKILDRYEKNGDYFNFLKLKQLNISKLIKSSEQHNLRVIIFFLDCLEKIYPFLRDENQEYVDEIIFFTAIISFEFKKGKIKLSKKDDTFGLDKVEEHYFSLELDKHLKSKILEGEEKEEPKSYQKEFYECYLSNKEINYFFYFSIFKYILSGFLNENALKDEIKSRYPKELPEHTKLFQSLLNHKFRELTNDDFESFCIKVLKFANEGKYIIYDYPQIMSFFNFFSENNLINTTKQEIKEIVYNGLEIAGSNSNIDEYILENLLHFHDSSPEVEAVKKKVEEIHLEKRKILYRKNGEELFSILADEDEYKLSSFFEKHKLSKDFIKYLDYGSLFSSVIKASNKQIFNFDEQIKHRYRISNIGEFLYEDIDCLTNLKEELRGHIKQTDINQPKLFLLDSLIKTLNDVCLHLEETRKK